MAKTVNPTTARLSMAFLFNSSRKLKKKPQQEETTTTKERTPFPNLPEKAKERKAVDAFHGDKAQ